MHFFFNFDAYQFSIQDLPTRKVLYQGLSKDEVYPIPPFAFLPSSSSFHVSPSGSTVVSTQTLL